MADEEFADDIDWAAAADSMNRQAIGGNDAVSVNQTGRGYRHQHQSNVPQGTTINQQQPVTKGAPLSCNTVLHQEQPDNLESLRTQIQQLQNQLQSKDETISDLQNTAALSQLESSHRIKEAEDTAQKLIHTVQQDLRQARMEAEKFKGNWMRSRKRVVELETASNNYRTDHHRVSNDNNHNDGNTAKNNSNNKNDNNFSAFGFPTDIETRRVTPSNFRKGENNNDCSTDQQLFENDNQAAALTSSGLKRKIEQSLFGIGDPTTGALSDSLVSQTLFDYNSQMKHDTVTQRLARHLIMRDEMGCYSFTQIEEQQLLLFDVSSYSSLQTKVISGETQQNPTAIIRQNLARGEETRSYVRSILNQTVDTESNIHRCMSSSGLFYTLLARMNSLFDNVKIKSDEDSNDHLNLMEQGQLKSRCTVSSSSVLYILRVMCDILVLSTKARDDLRYWLYQSQQPPQIDHGKKKSNIELSTIGQSRIEGLPSNQIKPASNDHKEALWTSTCRATSIERGNEWDPMTMSHPCKAFFGILVSLMTGRSYDSKPFDLESKCVESKASFIVQLIRDQAVCLALTLMSDAHPYCDAESLGRTPFLWKLWFDSLFPSHSGDESGTVNREEQEEDFISFLEVVDARGNSGRKRGKLPMVAVQTTTSEQRRNNNCLIHSYRHDANTEEQKILSVKIKCGIIQFFTQLVLSSSSVQHAIYQPNGSDSLPLARRVLAAVLDEIDGSILPLLPSSQTNADTQTVLKYLQLIYSCNHFILALSRSNEGIQMMRCQMRVESDKDGQTNWSQSAIACMTLALNGALKCADCMENEEFTPTGTAGLTPYLNGIAEQCVTFFKTLQSYVHNQKRISSKSKPPTFASLNSEQHLVLLSCFQKLITRERTYDVLTEKTCLLWISDGLKYDVQVMMEEALYDDV